MKAIGNLFLNNKIRAYGGGIIYSSFIGYAHQAITTPSTIALSPPHFSGPIIAAIFFGGKITSSSSSFGMGFYASTGQMSMQTRAKNAVTGSDSVSTSNTTKALHTIDDTDSTVVSTVNVDSVSGGNITTTFTNTEAVPTVINAMAFAANGADTVTKTFSNNEVYTRSGLSFTPNLIIIIGLQPGTISIGVANATGQYSVTKFDQTAANPSSVKLYLSNAYLIRNTEAATREVTFNSINSDGYTMTRGSGSSTTTFCILALQVEGTPVIGIYDTPTTTGDHLLNLGHFTIDHLIISTSAETINTVINTTNASGVSISAFNGETEYSYGMINRDNLSPVQTESYYSDSAIQLRDSVGTNLLAANVVELTEDGPILNWTDVHTFAKKMIVLGIYY